MSDRHAFPEAVSTVPNFIWHPATRLIDPDPAITALRDLVVAGRAIRSTADGVSGHDAPVQTLDVATSGSSGQPKIIRRTPESWQAGFAVNGTALGLSTQSRVAVFGGLAQSLALHAVMEAAHHGADILSLRQRRPDRQARRLGEVGATHLSLTPTQLALLCAGDPAPMPTVRQILVGGGPLSPAVAEAAARAFPQGRLTRFYGAAETSFITWTDADTPAASVGRAYPGVSLRIAPDGPDGTGTIWVRSPYLFTGYAEGQSSDTVWSDGWLSVGEVGWRDNAGYLYIRGRRSRMVTIADHNVFPEEVEALLARLLPARMIVVVPQPDPHRGAHLVAAVVGPRGEVDADALLRDCRRAIGPLAAPRRIHVLPEVPLLAAGKPDHAAIAQMLADRA